MYQLLLSPMTWGLLLAALLWLTWSRLWVPMRALGVVLMFAVLVLCTPLAANLLIGDLESRIPATAHCVAPGTPIVVLAGGLDGEPRANDDYAALTQASWRRLHGAVELWRSDPGSPLVIAGGGPFQIKEATVMGRLARDWGVPESALRTEVASTTTWESAFALRGTLPARMRLVSSAAHLPRALLSFRSAGFDPCVHASDSDYVPMGSVGYFLPQVSAVEKTQTALYELAGMINYRMRAGKQAPTTASR
ncbi:YdcF family protein [Lysobacter sp. S4-A87]|uniref:YdcF family protein n=1 Tax=Lysobacter sp. S4-A87 TaxID=2925843 RepID=UPI001F5337B2|nr:YdcF family protein [Lysobacter sp. S4-A87]UNK50274.1 YdcF family protein [Lysobacter sp. S4-A87]